MTAGRYLIWWVFREAVNWHKIERSDPFYEPVRWDWFSLIKMVWIYQPSLAHQCASKTHLRTFVRYNRPPRQRRAHSFMPIIWYVAMIVSIGSIQESSFFDNNFKIFFFNTSSFIRERSIIDRQSCGDATLFTRLLAWGCCCFGAERCLVLLGPY